MMPKVKSLMENQSRRGCFMSFVYVRVIAGNAICSPHFRLRQRGSHQTVTIILWVLELSIPLTSYRHISMISAG